MLLKRCWIRVRGVKDGMRILSKVLVFVTMTLPLAARAQPPYMQKTGQALLPLDAPTLVIQVCLPTKSVSFADVGIDLTGTPKAKTLRQRRESSGHYDEPKSNQDTMPTIEEQLDPDRVTVRRWIVGSDVGELKKSFIGFGEALSRDGIPSYLGDHISLWGNSQKNQPIFEKQGHRPNETVAVDVLIDVVKYWYKLPTDLAIGNFSAWQEPISQETRDTDKTPIFWDLTHGRAMPLHPVERDAPKMRFRLMTIEDYWNERRFWERAREAIAEKYYRGVVGEAREKIHFVPKVDGTIPGC